MKLILIALVTGGELTTKELCEALGWQYPCDRRHVMRIVPHLIDKHFITRTQTPGKATMYRIAVLPAAVGAGGANASLASPPALDRMEAAG